MSEVLYSSSDAYKSTPPTFKSKNGGIVAWENETKNGERYLSLYMEGHNPIKLWFNKTTEQKAPEKAPKVGDQIISFDVGEIAKQLMRGDDENQESN